MDAVRHRQAPQLEPRSRYSVTLRAPARSPATPRIHNPCILVLQDGDVRPTGDRVLISADRRALDRSQPTCCLAGRTIGAEYLRVCCLVSVIINLSLQAKNSVENNGRSPDNGRRCTLGGTPNPQVAPSLPHPPTSRPVALLPPQPQVPPPLRSSGCISPLLVVCACPLRRR